MNRNIAIYWLVITVMIGIAGAAGWHLGQSKSGGDAHGSHAEAKPEEAAKEPDDAGLVMLSPQALEQAQIAVKAIDEAPYTVTEGGAAMVMPVPLNQIPVTAPVGGIIVTLSAMTGELLPAGHPVVTLLRDPQIPPQLQVLARLLEPATEEYHSARGELRRTLAALRATEIELKRLQGFATPSTEGEIPLLPRQSVIDLTYEQQKNTQHAAILRQELLSHGVTAEQVAAIETGADPDLTMQIWQFTLRRSGFWSPLADRLLTALPDGQGARPWAISLAAELAAQERLTPELVEWLGQAEAKNAPFSAVAAMLLQGQTLADIQYLNRLGALSATVEIRLPATAADWDIAELRARVGEHVEAGSTLLVVANPQRMLLEARPSGDESRPLLAALKADLPMTAEPLIAGTGPTLTGLRVQAVTGASDDAHGDRPVVRIAIDNSAEKVTTAADGRRYRTWALRAGQRYLLRVPVRTIDKAMVVPATAVVEDGADKLVYVQDGTGFRPAKVVLAWQDRDHAVLAPGSDLFPGDPVVVRGAFQIHLAALAASGGGIDPHAGHNH